MGKIIIGEDDFVDANLAMIHSFVYDANATVEKEKKIKNLLMAKATIDKTLTLMGFSPDT